SVVFNVYAPEWFGNETLLYTAYQTTETIGGVAKQVYRIPFLICMGWSFFFTMAIMIGMSLAGPKVNPKAFDLDPSMFKLKNSTIVLIIIILMILAALYIKFW
ncbi:MAG: sodium transporter, partial [Flavitalea sp.]